MQLRSFLLGATILNVGLVGACAGGNETEPTGGAAGTSASGTGGAGDVSSSSIASSSSSGDATTASTATTSTTASDASTVSTVSTGPNLCGNGMIDSGEFCDGTDFGGKTCQDFGLSQGDLICNAFCGVVVTGCTPFENCFDEQDNDLDGDIDCTDSECTAEPGCTDSCASPQLASVPMWFNGNLAGKPDVISNSCGAAGGSEVVFRVVAPFDGNLAVRFSPWGTGAGSVAFRTTCDDNASELGCAAGTANNGISLSRPVVAGDVLFVVFEDNTGGGGTYDFNIDIPPPENFCNGLWDDDNDGLIDCDDPDACQSSPECMPQPNAGPYGQPCFQHNQCGANANDPVCLGWQQGFNNGYCSEFCDLAANDCAGDGVCVETGLSPIHGVCMDGCINDSDCIQGGCVESGIPGQKICGIPPELSCNDFDDNDGDDLVDCADATSCSTSSQCTSGPGPVGTPCQIHNQCQSSGTDPFCIDQFNTSWPSGYCSEWCDLAAQDCPAGATCVNPPFFINGQGGICLKNCAGPQDCRAGYFCNGTVCQF